MLRPSCRDTLVRGRYQKGVRRVKANPTIGDPTARSCIPLNILTGACYGQGGQLTITAKESHRKERSDLHLNAFFCERRTLHAFQHISQDMVVLIIGVWQP